jgi:hypothetical protein
MDENLTLAAREIMFRFQIGSPKSIRICDRLRDDDAAQRAETPLKQAHFGERNGFPGTHDEMVDQANFNAFKCGFDTARNELVGL